MTKDQQARNRRHWEAHLRAAAKSGLNRAEYCRQHNLSYHAMGYWHKRLSRKNSRQSFIPVKIGAIRAENHGDEQGLRIIFPGKMSVAVGDNFSPGTLNRLLSVLENR